MRHYLLTGGTGVIGSALLQRLINAGEKVTLLIRAKSDEHLNRRLDDLACFCQVNESTRSLIQAIKGDLYKPELGLSPEKYQIILQEITHILHCGGNVKMNLPLDIARENTLTMTRNMVALIEQSSYILKMEYVSTIGVGGDTPNGLPEEWILHDRVFHNSYEAAKSDAELFIKSKIEQGLNITVHRPSMVVGNSKSGRNISFQVFYFLCEFLSGAKTWGIVPDLEGTYLDIIPSDYVANLIYWASLQGQNFTKIIHACSGLDAGISLNELTQHVRTIYQENDKSLPAIKKVPIPVYIFFIKIIKLFASKKAKRSLNTLPLFLSYLKTEQFFINTKTRILAQEAGIELPFAKDYINKSIQYYLDTKT